ncbi:Iron-sulfur cluster assembly protein SufD [Candidatus Johnevansia muelleri]|uniref:Iron-sulfur cluster assembly protein SufD n=1 Tax=Candidatus Johnevansia muelleri TaxID=1495769 RepID=A0A078KAV4_9GAMM|nr:Iron-sulfur cluster assembly protein SufD [Candidatus Evansia muelleri]
MNLFLKYNNLQANCNFINEKLHNHMQKFLFYAECTVLKLIDPLSYKRKLAKKYFLKIGLPNLLGEAWKYTNIKKNIKNCFNLAINANFRKLHYNKIAININAHRLVFIDGVFYPNFSSLNKLNNGVYIKTLSSFLASGNCPKWIGDFSKSTTIFNALNLLFTGQGVVINIASNYIVDKPIYILYISRENNIAIMSNPHILIYSDKNSKANIIEHYVGEENSKNFINVVTEAWLNTNAHISHYKIQESGNKESHIANIQVHQGKNSSFNSHNLNIGSGALTRNDINVELNGKNSKTNLMGLFIGSGYQQIDNHTIINHNVPYTYSNEHYKGILNNYAHCVFNGRVYIKRGAQKVVAYLKNDNILLSNNCEIYTKPELEIYANDVNCSHGATTGQIDKNSLFFLQTRGIAKKQAQMLLMLGFIREILKSVNIYKIAEHVECIVGKVLKFN